jgi:hypothetical protein
VRTKTRPTETTRTTNHTGRPRTRNGLQGRRSRGCHGPYVRPPATDVAAGRLDLEALRDPELPDDKERRTPTRRAQLGLYVTGKMMVPIGRHAKLNGSNLIQEAIERHFQRYERLFA